MEELLESAEKKSSISQTFLKDKFVSIKEVLTSRFEVFAERHMSEGDVSGGIPTGYKGLDKYLSGLQPSDMIVLAARPSMGKTAFALSIAMNIALREKENCGNFLARNEQGTVGRSYVRKSIGSGFVEIAEGKAFR